MARDSASWPEALTVLGRTALMRGDPWTALDRLQAATSPYVRADRLALEADLLQAEAQLALCRHDEAEDGLASLAVRARGLSRVVVQHAEGDG